MPLKLSIYGYVGYNAKRIYKCNFGEQKMISQSQAEMIEDLPFKASDIWYSYLVALDKKPTAWLVLCSDVWRDGESPKHVDRDRIETVKRVFEEVGIKYEIRIRVSDSGIYQPDEGRTRLNEICDVFISKDKNDISELIKSIDNKDDCRIGMLLGYPKTAVDAFTDGSRIGRNELSPEVRYSEILNFVQFVLSKNNWQEEVGLVQGWVDELKSVSEITYLGCRRSFNVASDETRKALIEYSRK